MSFDYEKSIWGNGVAKINISNPTSIRLRTSLNALRKLPSESKILEIGCGAGQFIRAVKREIPHFDCYGSDVSLSAISKAKSYEDNVSYVVQVESKLPFEDNFFNAVLIYDVLEHVFDPEALLVEMNRVLKSGGMVYAFVPCEGDRLSVWNWLAKIDYFEKLTQKYAGHIQKFSRKSIIDLCHKVGFETLSIKFSEHFFGQLLGVAAFVLMNSHAKKNNLDQLNNERYFSSKGNGMFNFFKKLVNSIVFFESLTLQYVPSPNIHILLRKK